MTYTIFMLLSRKPGTTLEAFTNHYENIHMPLAVKFLGDVAPIRHTRYYLKRAPSSPDASTDAPGIEPPPLVFVGAPSTIDYDCVTVMEFEDEAHFGRFNEGMNGPGREEIDRDNALWADMASVRMFAAGGGMVTETKRG
jgi:hypothetical protein